MSVASQVVVKDRATKKLEKIAARYARLEQAARAADAATKGGAAKAAVAYDRTAVSVRQAGGAVEGFGKAQQSAVSGAGTLRSLWSRIKGYAASAGAALGAAKLIGLSDTVASTGARLDLINDGLQTTEELQDKIMASANRARAAYVDTAAAVSKLGILAGKAFSGNDEIIAFTELMNKNFVVGGASATEQAAAMYQLTQAMASGRLQGDEYRSIIENAPLLAQAIEDYMRNVQGATGTMKDWASEGLLTADVIKAAMFSGAEEVEERFAKMPMTFAQVGTLAGNMLLQAFDPALQVVGRGAQWIYDSWSSIAPVFWGLAAAVLGYAAALGIQTAATWIANGAAQAFFATLLKNPLFWIALAIGVVVAAIYKWVQSVGGLKVAWLIAVNEILTAWDRVKIGFMTGVYWVMDMWNKLQLAFATAGANMQSLMGDMKTGVLTILQNMINSAIGMINGFIEALNKIPGVGIELIDHVTFGVTAQLENEAAKQARANDLAAYRSRIAGQMNRRDAELSAMRTGAAVARRQRELEIASARADTAGSGYDMEALQDNVANIASSTGRMAEEVNIADEDLKFLRDVAEMRYIQNFVTLSPTVAMNASISERVDVDTVVSAIERRLEEEFAASAEGVFV